MYRFAIIFLLGFCLGSQGLAQSNFFNKTYFFDSTYLSSFSRHSQIIGTNYYLATANNYPINNSINKKYFLGKIDKDGNLLTYVDLGITDANFNGLQLSKFNNNKLLVRHSSHNVDTNGFITPHLISLDTNLHVLWKRKYNLFNEDHVLWCRFPENNTDYIYMAATIQRESNWENFDACLVKFDSLGNVIWKRVFDFDLVTTATNIEIIDGNLYISGATRSDYFDAYNGENRGFIAVFDTAGNEIWMHDYSETKSIRVWKSIISIDSNRILGIGCYIPELYGTHISALLSVISKKDGELLYEYRYTTYDTNLNNLRTSFIEGFWQDSSLYLVGNSRGCHANQDENGRQLGQVCNIDTNSWNIQWQRTYDPFPGRRNQAEILSAIKTPEGYATVGYATKQEDSVGKQRSWLMHLDSMGCHEPGRENFPEFSEVCFTLERADTFVNDSTPVDTGVFVGNARGGQWFSFYPNPLSAEIGILQFQVSSITKDAHISIHNSVGRLVYKNTLHTQKTEINLGELYLDSGLYFVTLNRNDTIQTQKLLLY